MGDLRDIVAELRQSRDLIQQLTLRDIRIRYKQAVFGFAWALLVPAAVVVSGLAVRIALSFAAGKGLDFSQIGGMAVKALPWAFFVGCISTGTQSLVANKNLVTKIYFPREVLPLGSVLAQSFDTLIGLGLLTIILPFIGVRPSLQLLWVPLLLVMLWCLALATALILSCLNLFFRDVKYLVQIFLTFGIFFTPVIFDAPMFGELGARVLMVNPVAPILEALRLTVVGQHNLLEPLAVTTPQAFTFWSPLYLVYMVICSFGGLLASALIFHRSERRFAEIV